MNTNTRTQLWLLSLLILTCLLLSSMIPSFESPDEHGHISRAYFLSKGHVIMEVAANRKSGGMMDTGLLSYFVWHDAFHVKPDNKLTPSVIRAAKELRWTGTNIYSEAPTMGFYFPLIYTPQAIGLMLGEKTGQTIESSYRLARLMALITIALLLSAAFILYPVNPLTMAILFLPMTLFQFSSASQDGVATALSVFAIACFLRLTTQENKANFYLYYLFALSIALVATSRIHLLTFLPLFFIACFYTKQRMAFNLFALTALFVTAWIIVATHATVGGALTKPGDTMPSVALFYLTHPFDFLHVLRNTLDHSDHLWFYRDSFVGILGWLEMRFSEKIYQNFCILLLVIGLLSFSFNDIKTNWLPRLALGIAAVGSALLMFCFLLIQWNPHPASIIEGVQGRYFSVPMIMLAYAISGQAAFLQGAPRKLAFALLLMLIGTTLFCMPDTLLTRYYG